MHFIRAALALVLVGVVACDDHEFKSESVAVSGEGLEAVKQVMESNCASCHSAGSPSAGLDLTAANFCENVMDGRMVIPGNAAGSVLQQRIEGDPSAMPPTGLMDDSNIQIVADWIDAGADCEGLGGNDDGGDGGGGDDGGDDGTTGGVDGATVYANSCAGCHGANGEGVAGPDMVTAVQGLTAEDVADVALYGEGTMPAILTDPEEAAAVGEYSVSEFGG